MPRLSKRKLQAHKANQVSVNVRKTVNREEQIQTINKALLQMNDNELEVIHQDIIQLTSNKKVIQTTRRQKLIETIKQLPDNQLKSASHMLTTMRYSKESQEGNLFSPFIQNKALNYVNSSLHKVGQDSKSFIQENKTLQKKINQLEYSNAQKSYKLKQLAGSIAQFEHKQHQNISKICAIARKPQVLDSRSLKTSIQAMLMKNKYEYTTQFINMATQVSQIDDSLIPISRQSIVRWNKEI
ncbi:18947_t:CDS:2, partial [Racocetra persica]